MFSLSQKIRLIRSGFLLLTIIFFVSLIVYPTVNGRLLAVILFGATTIILELFDRELRRDLQKNGSFQDEDVDIF